MLLSSIALIISTCLSGPCAPLASSYRLEEVNESAREIIDYASNYFDYSNYDLTYEEEQSLIKQKIYQFAENNNLLSIEELEYLKKEIVSSDDYTYFENIDSLFIKDDAYSLNAFNTIKLNDKPITNKFSISSLDHDGEDISSDNNDTESGVSTDYQLPILYCDTDKISISIDGKVDGCYFFGIVCSKDACVGLYNTLAGYINKQAIYQINGLSFPLALIVETLSTLVSTTLRGAQFVTFVSSQIEALKGALLSIWNEFATFLGSAGPIGAIIGIIIAIVGSFCIAIITEMIVYGYLGKGFAIGFKIHNIFWWEYIHEELD